MILYDPGKRWTYDYVRRMLETAPTDVPCLVLVRYKRLSWPKAGCGRPGVAQRWGLVMRQPITRGPFIIRGRALPVARDDQANFRDTADKHVVTRMEGEGLVAEFSARAGGTYFAECSMRDAFGLKFIHRFLNVPFLQMQVRARPDGRA